MKPLIYIYGTPKFVEEETVKTYRAALERAGAQVQHSSDPADAAGCDGLLLAGGGDMDPAYFGQENRGSNPPDPLRDRVEFALIREFLDANKPIIGICRGEQMLNVAFGGTLHQDMPGHKNGEDIDACVHPARAVEGSCAAALYGTDEVVINSIHHQAVDRVGDGLRATMYSPDGYVECIEHTSRPIMGLQWHPERLTCDMAREGLADGQKVFDWFVGQCAAAKA